MWQNYTKRCWDMVVRGERPTEFLPASNQDQKAQMVKIHAFRTGEPSWDIKGYQQIISKSLKTPRIWFFWCLLWSGRPWPYIKKALPSWKRGRQLKEVGSWSAPPRCRPAWSIIFFCDSHPGLGHPRSNDQGTNGRTGPPVGHVCRALQFAHGQSRSVPLEH